MVLVWRAMLLVIPLLAFSATPASASPCAYWEQQARCWRSMFIQGEEYHQQAQRALEEAKEHEARIYTQLIATISWWNDTFVPTMTSAYDSGQVVLPRFLSEEDLNAIVTTPPDLPRNSTAGQQHSMRLLREAEARLFAAQRYISEMNVYLRNADLSDAWQVRSMTDALILRQTQIRREIDAIAVRVRAERDAARGSQ